MRQKDAAPERSCTRHRVGLSRFPHFAAEALNPGNRGRYPRLFCVVL